jgi:hypothetical protein
MKLYQFNAARLRPGMGRRSNTEQVQQRTATAGK